jgi:hypothetical protein
MEPLVLLAIICVEQCAADLAIHLHRRRRLGVDRRAGNKQRRAYGSGDLRFTKLH